jgi:serine palmitoyltransferase
VAVEDFVQAAKKWLITRFALQISQLTRQRITSLAYVFSAALPAILAVTASESISLLSSKEGEEQLTLLTDNANTLRSILDKSEFVETSSDYNSPISHYRLNDMAISACGLTTLQDEERLLQDVVDEVCLRSEKMLTIGE